MQPHQHTNFDLAGRTGWIARTDRGCLRFAGGDAVKFLQALVTNDVASLAVGESCDAVYLTPQGRMITDMRIVRRDGDVIVSVPAELAANLASRFDLLIFSEDVQVSDVSASIREITLAGSTPAESRDIFVEDGTEGSVRATVIAAGLPELGAGDAEAMRIEAGRARWGVDMNEDTIPLEAGLLDRAISQTKGCYVGQEVIIRVLHRGGGRVAKRLMKITFADGVTAPPAAGTAISIDGADVGKITSAAWSERQRRVVALGYVHRDHANEGTAVTVGGAAAVIAGSAG
jgi:folate-binding protein YgfZ